MTETTIYIVVVVTVRQLLYIVVSVSWQLYITVDNYYIYRDNYIYM